MWVGRTEESDEHLVVNEIGHVVRVRTVRRCVENENSGPDVIQLFVSQACDDVKIPSQTDGLRRQDAGRVSQHTETSIWYDVKHVDTSIEIRTKSTCDNA